MDCVELIREKLEKGESSFYMPDYSHKIGLENARAIATALTKVRKGKNSYFWEEIIDFENSRKMKGTR